MYVQPIIIYIKPLTFIKNMKKRSSVPGMFASIVLLVAPASAHSNDASQKPVTLQHQNAQKSQLLFTENRGQIADLAGTPRPDILFTAHSGSTNLFLKSDGIYYQFTKINYPDGYRHSGTEPVNPEEQARLEKQIETQTYNFSLTLEGANPHPKVIRENKSISVKNFYLAQCPAGITNVPSYQKLVYEEVYPHIDWVLYNDGDHLKYDFIVKKGGNPAGIKLRIKNAEKVNISESGELVMTTSLGEVKEKAPVTYADGLVIKSRFHQNSDGTIGFDIADHQGTTLRIDPSVLWATYFGGGAIDYVYGAATDNSGNILLAGNSNSTNAIGNGGFQTTYGGGGNDAYIAKFNTSGDLLWSTYYGGAGDDFGSGCAVDGSGNIYLAGYTTTSTNLASGGFQNTLTAGTTNTAYLAKFTPSGSRIWATYYNGTAAAAATFPPTGGQPVCTDISGNVYMTGSTNTAGISSSGFQNTLGGGTDAYLVKFDAAGNRIWATYYGGTSGDIGYGCAADANGNIYMAGLASSTGMASGGFQNTAGGSNDAFLAKFDASGNRLWATYYGNTGAETGYACTSEANGNVYMTGSTNSTTGIASGGVQNTAGGSTDGFIVKFNANGTRSWATYYGGTGSDQFRGCTGDATGCIYFSGISGSTAGISSNGFQNTSGGGNDAMLLKLDSAGNRIWASYYGGTGTDNGFTCAAGASDFVYLAGYTNTATGIILPGTYQPTFGAGTYDGFLVKIGNIGLFTSPTISTPICAGATINVPYTKFGPHNSGNVFTAQLSNASGSFVSPVNIGTRTDTAAGTIIATIPAGTPAGTGYRIRVISSSPALVAPNNGTDLTISAGTTVPVVTITVSPNDTICAGTPVTFTATPVNGGTNPTYQWYKGTTQVGTNSPTYTDNGIVNNNVISVVMISNESCTTVPTDTSNFITMTVNTAVTPVVTIAANPGNTICPGTSVTFTATPTSGGTPQPDYSWYLNNTLVGTNSTTYTNPSLGNNDVIYAIMTTHALCPATPTDTSNMITMSVTTNVTPVVTISVSPNDTVCAGTAVTFTATPTNGGTNPDYQWYRNNVLVGTNSSTYTNSALTNNDAIYVIMTSHANCVAVPTDTSNIITMTIKPSVTPSVSISISPNDTICAGTSVTFTANPSNGGTYEWFNGSTSLGNNNPVYTSSTLTSGNAISVKMTSNLDCASPNPVNSNTITMTVNAVPTPAVSISVSPNDTVCAGTAVTFTANPSTGGTYEWYNGTNSLGNNNPVYTSSTLSSGNVITVKMTSNAACAPTTPVTSNAISMTVTPAAVPDITISATPGNIICAGASVTFNSSFINSGATPVYQWRKNGTTVATTATYTSNTLNNGDTIICIGGSSLGCVTKAIDTSNAIIMTVNSTAAPTVTISATPGTNVSAGTLVTFTAAIVNGGATPLYEWKKNGVVVSNNPTYATNTLVNGDVITCTITSSNTCVTTNVANSNPLAMDVSTGIGQVGSTHDLALFPNPNSGTFKVKGTIAAGSAMIEVMNVVGQTIYQQQENILNNKLDTEIHLPADVVANGTYLLRIRTGNSIDAFRFVISR